MPLLNPLRCFAFLVTVSLTLSVCSSCSLPFQKQESDGSGYLFTVSLPSNPKSLDPQSATDASSKTIITNLYEGLVELDESGMPQLAAAENVNVSADGLIYTFQLKNDRYWYYDTNQNDVIDEGESWQVTASDYVYAFQRIFDPQTQSPYTDMFSCLTNASAIQNGQMDYTQIGVNAVSDTQLQFSLDQPDAQFLSHLASTAAMPCNESFFLQTKGRYGLDQECVASCGAFYLRLWFYDPYGSDNLIYMRRNSANTEARSVYPANLTFQIKKNSQDTAEDFADGSSDVLATSIYQSQYMESDRYTVTSSRVTTLGLIFNPDNTAFANANIRKGLSMGIDRSAIGENSNGDLFPAYGIIPPDVHCSGKSYRELVPEAKTAYDAAAAVDTFQKGMKELHIESLDSTKILVCSTLMDCENLHDIIQTWQEIFGFYIGIEEVSESDYWKRIADKNYTIAVYGITGSSDSPASVLEQFGTDANRFYYSSHTVDSLITGLKSCSSSEELQQKCQNLEQAILTEGQFLPIFYKNQYCITRSSNADIGYDPFSGALNFRNAKHFE
ncbi:peptide ABC transporter substrate-binding protein [uncultured Ruminococcus sp.]|uniref:peptide ABC transporter substrate-binding protein n=1 Tax=uncultured Ruminococcus sp. TaxID=165186 RepID=UPI0026026272|nr:peptide ABC transporter substrate-binding protein [uncultured Ruminococcus sp.]